MYAKSTRPSAKREVQKERSAKRDDRIAHPRRVQTCEWSELRAMRMCPRSGQIFSVTLLLLWIFVYIFLLIAFIQRMRISNKTLFNSKMSNCVTIIIKNIFFILYFKKIILFQSFQIEKLSAGRGRGDYEK